jgi:hypothetical protein
MRAADVQQTGLSIEEPVWDHSTLTKNRGTADRSHFTVDGIPI